MSSVMIKSAQLELSFPSNWSYDPKHNFTCTELRHREIGEHLSGSIWVYQHVAEF